MIRFFLAVLIILLSACATTPTVRTEPKNEPPVAVKPPSSTPTRPRCLDCGTVKDIRKVTQAPASTNATAAQKPPVLGGIVGGVLSKPSTQIQEEYEVLVQLLSGKQVLVLQKILSTGLKVGSKVRVSQGRILAVSP
jgi:outer membrane lipoprotein SlyB